MKSAESPATSPTADRLVSGDGAVAVVDDSTDREPVEIQEPQVQNAVNAGAAVVTQAPRVCDADEDVAKMSWWQRLTLRLERKVSELSTKNNFWHRLCSWIWLPLAFRSGIKVARAEGAGDATFTAFLPFRRFNRNWYNAMAGAALLANSEVAGGMYVFQKCGGNYTVVCKELTYKFLRPCVGPALYRVEPHEDIEAKVAAGGEFNITVDMHVVQLVTTGKEERERRVGNCTATFHVTPKSQVRKRKQRRLEREMKRQPQA